MIRGLYTSGLGMITQMNRMDVVTNNIANVDTAGYKKDHVVAKSFTEELMRRLNDPSLNGPYMRLYRDFPVGNVTQGVYVDEVYTDFSAGSMRHTAGSLDVALNGQGFFVVNTEGQELYTRDGSFTLMPDGTLSTSDGGHVQGQNGDIYLPNGFINIDETGNVYVNNEYIDTLQRVDFTDRTTLRKMQDNYYRATDESETAPADARVVQGYLENSNVSSVREMVDMITYTRAYETNSRMITIHDTMLGHAVNEIAKR